MRRLWVLLVLLSAFASGQDLTVGSKRFTESYVLGEIIETALDAAGADAEHKQGMGGTIVLWEALRSGQIDVYPEYTGTISEEILKSGEPLDGQEMRTELAKFGIGMTETLGFNNTYALVMRRARAEELGIEKISDLPQGLKAGVTPEFLGRADGWKPMAAAYGLQFGDVRAIEHALGYQALAAGEVDVKDAYSTDAKIGELDMKLLEDDREFFPKYDAVLLYRLEMEDTPALAALKALEGTIDEERMIALNGIAEQTNDYAAAAAEYFLMVAEPEAARQVEREDPARRILELTGEHLVLVGLSLLLAVIAGVPLGIVAGRPGGLSQAILGTTGIIQTIPSLALLALLVPIPFFGIKPQTAIFALFLYSLLPIVRNTATGLRDIPPPVRESAEAMGLEPGARLRKVYLPMASSTILAGIKTSAVINVGTATLAALIGAGGLGEPIISGLNLNDPPTIMMGAVPAAVLAVLVQAAFELVDRAAVPKGLRLEAKR